jgi:predicted cupin superfamily sugar epimerase
MKMMTARQLIQQYELIAHPEGGHYRQTYRSIGQIPKTVLPSGFHNDRCYSTAIYFLLEGKEFSAFHRIASDEVWHFYAGTGLVIYVIHKDGRGEVLKLGNDPEKGFHFQQVVPAGAWFASRPAEDNNFSFAGCTVAPGFDFEDFEMADRSEMLQEYPQHREWIEALCI